MDATHHLPVALQNYGKNTWMFCSVREPRNLVVFVHGFGGKSLSTWFTFESLLPAQGPQADILFYGYDAFFEHIQPNAVLLQQTIGDIVSAPSLFISRHAPQVNRSSGWRGYRRVVLVAHSMGAIVCRRALIIALTAGKRWPDMVRLVLFAPAHTGVDDAVRLALGVRDPFGVASMASQGLTLASGALRDLLNAATFTRLATDTKAARQRRPKRSRCLVAKRVVFGSRENVVSMERFDNDPFPPTYIRNKGHLSVCKPNHKFTDPVDIVAAELI